MYHLGLWKLWSVLVIVMEFSDIRRGINFYYKNIWLGNKFRPAQNLFNNRLR